MKANPGKAKRIAVEFIKMDGAFVEQVWNSYDFRATLGQALLVSLEDQARWAIKNRLTQQKVMPNWLDFIYEDGLRTVKPDAVRIIR